MNGTDWAKYSAGSGVIPFAPGDYSNDLASGQHVRLTASPGVVGNLTERTLNLDASTSTVNLTQTAGTAITLCPP